MNGTTGTPVHDVSGVGLALRVYKGVRDPVR